MSEELVYTSVPRGLKQGSSGFCMVAMSEGMREQWVERLEMLSGYRPVFPLGHPSSKMNPVNWAHWHITVGGRTRSVLSRIAFAGADYSQRSNKFAHHLVLEPSEQPPAGPAWLMMQPEVMLTSWEEEPRYLPDSRALPTGDQPPGHCKKWEALVGDAGWAGALAETFRDDPTKPAYLIFSPGTNLLPLFAEALALLPPSLRWQVTFSTYFTGLPAGTSCNWRGVVAGSASTTEIGRPSMPSKVFDLTKPLGTAPDSALAKVARTGIIPPESDYDAVQQLRPLPSQIVIDLEDKVAPPRQVRRRSLTNVADAVLEESPVEGLEPINLRSTDLRSSRTSWLMPSLIGCAIGLAVGIAIGFGLSRFSSVPARPAIAASEKPKVLLSAETQHRLDPAPQTSVVKPIAQLAPPPESYPSDSASVKKIATTKSSTPAPATRGVSKSPATEPLSTRPTGPARQLPLVKIEVASLPELGHKISADPGTAIPWPESRKSAALVLHFPNGKSSLMVPGGEGEQFELSAESGSRIRISLRKSAWHSARYVASIDARDQQIWFVWETAVFDTDIQSFAPQLWNLLQVSTLSLSDGSASLSFLPPPQPISGSENPVYHTFEVPVALPAPVADLVRLDVPLQAGGSWLRKEPAQKNIIRYAAPLEGSSDNFTGELLIQMQPGRKQQNYVIVSRSWPTAMPSDLLRNLQESREKKNKSIERLNSLKNSGLSKETKEVQSESKELEGQEKLEKEYNSKIKLYSKIKDLTVSLVLPNGVVVAKVLVPRPDLSAEMKRSQ